MTRQSQSPCLHWTIIRCYSVCPDTLTLKSTRQTKHLWEVKANVTQRRCITTAMLSWVERGCRSDCGDGPPGTNVEGVGGEVSRPSLTISCCQLKTKVSIFFLTDDTSPRSLNGWATPRFPGSALHSFQGLCIALTCLSLGRSFRQKWKQKKQALGYFGNLTQRQAHFWWLLCIHVSGAWLQDQVPYRTHQPSEDSLSEATVGPQRVFESTKMSEAQNILSHPQ